jgi:hypothetical protein
VQAIAIILLSTPDKLHSQGPKAEYIHVPCATNPVANQPIDVT